MDIDPTLNNEKTKISQKDISRILDSCYEKCLNGIPKVSQSVEDLANDYLSRYDTPEKACKAMLKNQVTKCTTSGFVTGLGGVLTMPITLPVNLTNVIYIQMRMVACTAYMAGFDLNSDETRTFVYACLAGVAVNSFVKKFATEFGQKLSTGLIKKIPGTVLKAINKKVPFQLITKFGSRGLINLGKLVPAVGGVVGGTLDFAETKVIANRAYSWFFKHDFSSNDET